MIVRRSEQSEGYSQMRQLEGVEGAYVDGDARRTVGITQYLGIVTGIDRLHIAFRGFIIYIEEGLNNELLIIGIIFKLGWPQVTEMRQRFKGLLQPLGELIHFGIRKLRWPKAGETVNVLQQTLLIYVGAHEHSIHWILQKRNNFLQFNINIFILIQTHLQALVKI